MNSGDLDERRRKREQALFRNSRRERCARFCHNPEDSTYCGRTCLGWVEILAYYILFIAIFGAIWTFLSWYCVNGTELATVRKFKKSVDSKDKYPGPTFVGSNMDGYPESIIWYTTSGNTGPDSTERGYGVYLRQIRKMFREQAEGCEGEKCPFKPSLFGPCNGSDFGYSDKKPCIFMRLGSIYKWKPKSMKTTRKSLPAELQHRMDNSRSCLWVSCGGVDAFDKDNLGNFTYYPEGAYHEDYFPQTGSASPIIALHLHEKEPSFS